MQEHRRHFLLVVNPKSGRKGARALGRCCDALKAKGLRYTCLELVPDWHTSVKRIKQSLGGVSEVIALGGDGTVNIVVNALMHSDLPLGIVPVGTGNDTARSLYAAKDSAIDIAIAQTSQAVDVGNCNGHYFINVLGIGFDAALVQDLATGRRFKHYWLSTIKKLFAYDEQALEFNGQLNSGSGDTFMLTLCNGRYFGGGMQIAPRAYLNDGKLDCCWIKKAPLLHKLAHMLSLGKGRHLASAAVEYWQDTSLRIPSPGLPMEADGEYIGLTPATITLHPGALRLKTGSGQGVRPRDSLRR